MRRAHTQSMAVSITDQGVPALGSDWRCGRIPLMIPLLDIGGTTVNYLQLSRHDRPMNRYADLTIKGDYLRAVEQKIASEIISKVLYPSDAVQAGRELRLVQEYFLWLCYPRYLSALSQIACHFRGFSLRRSPSI